MTVKQAAGILTELGYGSHRVLVWTDGFPDDVSLRALAKSRGADRLDAHKMRITYEMDGVVVNHGTLMTLLRRLQQPEKWEPSDLNSSFLVRSR